MKNWILGISIVANVVLIIKNIELAKGLREYKDREDYYASLAPYKVGRGDDYEQTNTSKYEQKNTSNDDNDTTYINISNVK